MLTHVMQEKLQYWSKSSQWNFAVCGFACWINVITNLHKKYVSHFL